MTHAIEPLAQELCDQYGLSRQQARKIYVKQHLRRERRRETNPVYLQRRGYGIHLTDLRRLVWDEDGDTVVAGILKRAIKAIGLAAEADIGDLSAMCHEAAQQQLTKIKVQHRLREGRLWHRIQAEGNTDG